LARATGEVHFSNHGSSVVEKAKHGFGRSSYHGFIVYHHDWSFNQDRMLGH